jgi:hypothetical protein
MFGLPDSECHLQERILRLQGMWQLTHCENGLQLQQLERRIYDEIDFSVSAFGSLKTCDND